jgi:hypothetical protein
MTMHTDTTTPEREARLDAFLRGHLVDAISAVKLAALSDRLTPAQRMNVLHASALLRAALIG